MAHVFLVGQPEELSDLTRLLLDRGHRVSAQALGQASDAGNSVQKPSTVPAPTRLPERVDQSVMTFASAATLTAIARRTDRERVTGASHTARAQSSDSATSRRLHIERMSGRNQAYSRDERVSLPDGWAAGIVDGIVVQSAFLNDGAEVIIGFLGPGDFLLPHPWDSCRVEVVAQSDLHVKLAPLDQTMADPAFVSALCARVLWSEAWATAVAHTYVEQRLMRVLELLGQQLGVVEGGWLKIGIRITHTQLAAIIGSTRPTITRLVKKFEEQGSLRLVGRGADRRLHIAQGASGL